MIKQNIERRKAGVNCTEWHHTKLIYWRVYILRDTTFTSIYCITKDQVWLISDSCKGYEQRYHFQRDSCN